MSIRKLIKDIRFAVKDPQRDFSERVFLILTIISEVTVFIGLVGDIVTGENIKEIIAISVVLVAVPLITITCMYRNKIMLAIRLIIAGLLLFALPALFFFGGGVEGGGVIWFVFAFLYVGLVISGVWRRIVLFLLVVEVFVSYILAYYYPELVVVHSRKVFFVDSFLSIVLVGVVCFVMTLFQNRLFVGENERAKKEAQKAEELTRSQNRFFSSMSHEIRTPINSILGLNELILRDKDATEEIINDAMGISGSGKMLLALINDILDFSRMEAGGMDIVPVDYHVGNMLSEIVNMIWVRANDKGLKFDVNIDPKVPSVLYGDEVRVKQIIINLLNNAVKYTQEGSIGLRLEIEGSYEEKVLLRISISDTGMGIKKEAIPHLFEAFKRVDEQKNRFIEGTGLGLSIVKQLVDLMDGTIAVDSIYGEGSTFVVTLVQGVSDKTEVGELSIHNQKIRKHGNYESSFKAPSVRLLIVDDNEMNLEVEKKLLADTGMMIDTVLSGKEALKKSFETKYDVIFMDHLMPEMDGIECLKNLRNQVGGFNRTTPIIVLTANAGSDNRELYNSAGFDGYLVKPVSGAAMEEVLIRHISPNKLILGSKVSRMRMDVDMTSGYVRKMPVIITSSSMCDLPDEMIKRLNIPIIPFMICTDYGVFKDVEQLGADELVRYMNTGGRAVSVPPDIEAYTDFFANTLKRAHHLIHISIVDNMSEDYQIASEAAKAFDNVTVINSGALSSASGILTLIAVKLAQQGTAVSDIITELENVKDKLRCSFVINTTEYMMRKGLISSRVHKIANVVNLHPFLKISEEKSGIGGAWIGSTKRAYKKYIHKAFPVDIIPDSEVLFITYASVPEETLLWIKEEISKIAYFENVVFMQASAAISSNCGPGSFGILYFVKGNKTYNISSLIKDEDEDDEYDFIESRPQQTAEVYGDADSLSDKYEETSDNTDEEKTEWYFNIEGIDGETAIKNSGSKEALLSVLKIFYESIPVKYNELNNYYEQGDWTNYTIKIHALKSSAKLVGATELSETALKLETAGKNDDTEYIKNHHESVMRRYLKYQDILEEYCGNKAQDDEKPVAEDYIMESVYEAIREAAETMDCEAIEAVFREMEDYTIPENEIERYNLLHEKAGKFDYEGIIKILEG